MGLKNSGFESDTDESLAAPGAGPESGDGGGTMSVWEKTRVPKLKALSGKTFTNNSNFSIPPGIVNYDNQPFEQAWDQQEEKVGVRVSGQSLDENNKPMSGTVKLEQGGVVQTERDIAGNFQIAAEAPAGVVLGDDLGLGTYDFRFSPPFAALDYFKGGIGVHYDAGNIKYGAIAGTVTDYAGDPVDGALIAGEGEATKTDAAGSYTFRAPGGVNVTLSGVGTTKSTQTTGGTTQTVNWQYGRLVVEVLTPSTLEPVAGAPVQIGQESYTTDEQGQAVVDPAPVATYSVLVSDQYGEEVTLQQEGDLLELRMGDESDKAGVDLRVVDAETGAPITGLPGLFPTVESRAASNVGGRLRVFTDDPTEDELVIGRNDIRYQAQHYNISLTAGDTVEGRVELEPKPQVSNI